MEWVFGIVVIWLIATAISGAKKGSKDTTADKVARERAALRRMGERSESRASGRAEPSKRKGKSSGRTRSAPPWESIDTARVAFKYEDANGDKTAREVDVHQLSGDRFHGFCHHARGVRTFRIDRVVGPIVDRDTGEEQDPEVWMALAES
jgi:predicted DNA-binding transcriptional regulator YafY